MEFSFYSAVAALTKDRAILNPLLNDGWKRGELMRMHTAPFSLSVAVAIAIACVPSARAAGNDGASDAIVIGIAVRAGGRFDNARKCVASPTGTRGGPAADISLFADFPVSDTAVVHVDLPLMRPILFGAAFEMLQFEPSVGLLFRKVTDGNVDVIAGPTLGLSLHYGPDYTSERSGSGRKPSFFAMGPIIGGYVGLDFKRPGEAFNFQLGLSPFVTPLFGVNDPEDHKGVVVGGLLDGLFRFSL